MNEKVTAIDFDESNRPFRSICINKSTAVSENIQRSIDAINRGIFDYRAVQPFAEKYVYIYIYRNETGVGELYYVPFQSGWESRFRKVSLMNDGGVGFHDAEAKIRDLNSSIDSRARARSRHASRSRVIHAYTPATRGGDSFIRASAGFGHALLHPCLSLFTDRHANVSSSSISIEHLISYSYCDSKPTCYEFGVTN